MIEAVELLWYRCLDGYRIQEPEPDQVQAYADAEARRQAGDPTMTTLSGPSEPGLRIVPASERWSPYFVVKELAQARDRANLAEIFVNTPDTPEGAVEFTSRFGAIAVREWRENLLPVKPTETWEESLQKGILLRGWSAFHSDVRTVFDVWSQEDYLLLEDIFTRHDLGRAHVKLISDKAQSQAQMQIQPDDLRALIWIETARLVAGGAKVRTCRVCKKLMVVGGTAEGYSTREVCSHRCRMIEYRARQKAKAQRGGAGKDKKGRAPA